ncbi:uncharacterized protein LOC125499780 [Athalia rosae]|uniref:uncharacterized protein LOC125499780 n=1 Tax=Athalia rosae TaxID=37344 RepID=UPI0020337E7E|nr:uncharacterized protein LOC125499780 [Athalia rosae]
MLLQIQNDGGTSVVVVVVVQPLDIHRVRIQFLAGNGLFKIGTTGLECRGKPLESGVPSSPRSSLRRTHTTIYDTSQTRNFTLPKRGTGSTFVRIRVSGLAAAVTAESLKSCGWKIAFFFYSPLQQDSAIEVPKVPYHSLARCKMLESTGRRTDKGPRDTNSPWEKALVLRIKISAPEIPGP